jgi:hypothetical protein
MARTLRSMGMCDPGIRTKLIYHDGQDWIVDLRGDEYWSSPLDEEHWQQGLPLGMTSEDLRGVFSTRHRRDLSVDSPKEAREALSSERPFSDSIHRPAEE